MTCLEICKDIVSMIGTIGGLIIASLALSTWKRQLDGTERYKTMVHLEEMYKNYLIAFVKFRYVCQDKLNKNLLLTNCIDANLEELNIFLEAELKYRFAWSEATHFLNDNEKEQFEYLERNINLRGLFPKQDENGTSNLDESFEDKMDKSLHFEDKMDKLLHNGLAAIRKLRK